MDYWHFKEIMYPLGFFTLNQILMWDHYFDRNNLTRWCRKGLLVKLRNNYYTFPEYKLDPDFVRCVANQIYQPSYISLRSALSYYEMITDIPTDVMSVTTHKTALFTSEFGTFTYQHLTASRYFGYITKKTPDGRMLYIATPEKALLDLLYLNTNLKTKEDMENLQLNRSFMQRRMNKNTFFDLLHKMDYLPLNQQVKSLFTAYEIYVI